MAATGLKPVVVVYSSFLQRAYDQIVHDKCRIQNRRHCFSVDRAGCTQGSDERRTRHFRLDVSVDPIYECNMPKNSGARNAVLSPSGVDYEDRWRSDIQKKPGMLKVKIPGNETKRTEMQ